ncbi:unnamed protein product [Prorocentrum cordatum]|uniref:Uncharacterized protein n=1 Tax=Prorocentrum cordatum TaxID=2364126 RepID=A0ABN9RT64_9DINO|nr:unnamed protein product [Polarella glacialis]
MAIVASSDSPPTLRPYGKWDTAPSASARYGNAKGRVLDDLVRADYVDEERWLPLFGKDGQQLLTRHERLNVRNQCDNRLKYKKLVLTIGCKPNQRNEMVFVPKARGSEGHWCLSGAHLVEAIYEAHAEQPENPQVIASVAGGVKACVLDCRSPDDILSHFKEDGNGLNHIRGQVAFTESVGEVGSMQKKWKDSRKGEFDDHDYEEHKSKFDNKKYESEYMEFLDREFPGYFEGNWNLFDMTRRVYNKFLKVPEIHAEWRAYCDQHCVYSNTRLDTGTTMYIMDKLMTKVAAYDLWDHLVDIFKFCIPTNDGHEWHCTERKDWVKILALFMPITHGKRDGEKVKVEVLAEKAKLNRAFKAKAAADTTEKDEGKKDKTRKKGKGRGAKGKGKSTEVFNQFQATKGGRDVIMFEEIIGTIEYAVEDIGDQYINRSVLSQMKDVCITWALQGGTVEAPPLVAQAQVLKYEADEKKIERLKKTLVKTSWSSLKKHVVMLIRERRQFAPKTDMDAVLGEDTQEHISSAATGGSVARMKLDPSEFPGVLNVCKLEEAVAMVTDECMIIYKNFISKNTPNHMFCPTGVLKMSQPALQSMGSTLYALVTDPDAIKQWPSMDVDESIKTFVGMIASAIFRTMPQDMVHFMRTLHTAVDESGSGYAELSKSKIKVLRTALEYALNLIADAPMLMAAAAHASDEQHDDAFDKMTELWGKLKLAASFIDNYSLEACAADAQATCQDTWVAMWSKLLIELMKNPSDSIAKRPRTELEFKEWARAQSAKISEGESPMALSIVSADNERSSPTDSYTALGYRPISVDTSANEFVAMALANRITSFMMGQLSKDVGADLVKHKEVVKPDGTTTITAKMFSDFGFDKSQNSCKELSFTMFGNTFLMKIGVQPTQRAIARLGEVVIGGATYVIWASPTPAMHNPTGGLFVPAWGVIKIREYEDGTAPNTTLSTTRVELEVPECSEPFALPKCTLSVPVLIPNIEFLKKNGATEMLELTRPELPEEKHVRLASSCNTRNKRTLKAEGSDDLNGEHVQKFAKRAAA